MRGHSVVGCTRDGPSATSGCYRSPHYSHHRVKLVRCEESRSGYSGHARTAGLRSLTGAGMVCIRKTCRALLMQLLPSAPCRCIFTACGSTRTGVRVRAGGPARACGSKIHRHGGRWQKLHKKISAGFSYAYYRSPRQGTQPRGPGAPGVSRSRFLSPGQFYSAVTVGQTGFF